MYSTFAESEKKPLINDGITEYGNGAHLSKEKATPTYPWKLKVIVFALLLITAIVVYSIFPRNTHHNGVHDHNWVTLETSPKTKAPVDWTNVAECDEDTGFTLTFAVALSNVDELDQHVMDVSDPKSENYLKFWTTEQTRNYFAPSEESVFAVRKWLNDNGIEESRISASEDQSVIRVETTCKEAGLLLNTHYRVWEHKKTGKKHYRVENGDYQIPSNVADHLDFVTPTTRFPFKKHLKDIQVLTDSEMKNLKSSTGTRKQKWIEKQNGIVTDVEATTTVYNTPEEIKQLYGMEESMAIILKDETSATMAASSARQAIASFIEEYYDDTDLETFWEYFELDPVSEMLRVPATQPDGYGSEAELDTQYITSTGAGVYTYVFYEDGDNIFVELATAILEEDTVPSVVSISYGADEYELGETYVRRCNTEFGKLALVGCSVFASAGDAGVTGNDEVCYEGTIDDMLDSDSETDTDESMLKAASSDYCYIASFPACAMYVTAVGGTTDGEYTELASESTGEKAWVDSGGGFSIYFTRPEYQDAAVQEYFDSDDVTINYARFANTGRAYPDVSLQSIDYIIAYEEAFYSVSGTSCSSPTFAGMISLINFARLKAGKSYLGFINPALYAFYYESQLDDSVLYFNDVIEGYNVGCSVDDDMGFAATTGWDPVTGLGTAKFASLYNAFMEIDCS